MTMTAIQIQLRISHWLDSRYALAMLANRSPKTMLSSVLSIAVGVHDRPVRGNSTTEIMLVFDCIHGICTQGLTFDCENVLDKEVHICRSNSL